MLYPNLAKVIIGLKDADLALRDQLIKDQKLGEGYNEAMAKLHNDNAATLNKIIDEIGYPTIDKVGEAASAAAWLVIQHSIGQPQFMKKCAKLLAHVAQANKNYLKSLAYLTDRIASYEDQPQLYGTQFDWDENGALNPKPFDDLLKVNQRRKALGLNTLEEQTAIIRREAATENHFPPKDLRKRKKEYDAWRKKVGWI